MRTVEEYIDENDCEVMATGAEAQRIIKREFVTRGISDARLAEMCDAEKDGRCVVLPAALGEIVNTKYGEAEVVAWDTTARVKILDEPDFMKRYKDFDIGSKVFTRPEAEAAKGGAE